MAEANHPETAESLAKELRRRGLAAPVHFLLDAHRPLRPLLGDALTFLRPTLQPILGRQVGEIERAVRDPDAYDRLVESLADGPDR